MSLSLKVLHRAAKVLSVTLMYQGRFTPDDNKIKSRGKLVWQTNNVNTALANWERMKGEPHGQGKISFTIEANIGSARAVHKKAAGQTIQPKADDEKVGQKDLPFEGAVGGVPKAVQAAPCDGPAFADPGHAAITAAGGDSKGHGRNAEDVPQKMDLASLVAGAKGHAKR